MIEVVLLGFGLGLDSFRVGVALATAQATRGRERELACAFGVSDGAALLVGAGLGHSLSSAVGNFAEPFAAAVLAGYALYVLVIARRAEADRIGGSAVFGLPLVLSLDNIVAGALLGALGAHVLAASLVVGLISGALALVGLRLGGWLGSRLHRAAPVTGAILILAAAAIAFA